MTKNYNSSKSNTSSVKGDEVDGPTEADIPTTKNYNSSKSNTSSVSEAPVGDGGGPGEPAGDVRSQGEWGDINQDSKTNTIGYQGHLVDNTGTQSVRGEDGLTPDGGGGDGPDPQMIKNYNSSKSNTSEISVEDDLVGDGGGGGDVSVANTYSQGLTPDGGGGGGDGSTSAAHEAAHVVQQRGGGSGGGAAVAGDGVRGAITVNIVNPKSSGGGSGGGTGVIGSTFGLAKTILTAAVLLTAAGVGFDLYETYNDAIDLNLEDHVTDADFALNGDKTEINGDISFNIPEMGRFEKKILAQVHVTVLESSPTTTGDYSFEYTLGSGEQTYKFSLTNLDPVTVGKINAGEDLELEYTTSITVIYLGVELAPATTDMPAKTVTVETA